jgi:thiamine-phosphate pyrophosphorylase
VLPRVYPILDTSAVVARGADPFSFAEALFEGGAQILQFRHKAPYDRAAVELLGSIAELARSARATLIVNDRADLAAVFDCGLHLGQTDLPPALARKVLPPPNLIGLSTHNASQLAAAVAEPVDYLALGPIFSTGSKENPDPAVGPGHLRAWRLLATKPLVAIGGITLETAPAVWRAGADSIAVISALIPADPSPAAVRAQMEQWLSLSRLP